MKRRVFIIGHGLFREGLTLLLEQTDGLAVVGAADSWAMARPALFQTRPDVLIVDHNTANLSEADLAPLLQSEGSSLKVIYLTLEDNRMTVQHQQQVSRVSDLLSVLQAPPAPGEGR